MPVCRYASEKKYVYLAVALYHNIDQVTCNNTN